MSVTRLARLEDRGQWIIEVYDELTAVLPLPSIGCEIPLREIYDKVEFGDEFIGGA